MKLLLLLLLPAQLFAQVHRQKNIDYTTIGEAKMVGVPVVSLQYRTDDKDTVYLLTFKDLQYEVLIQYTNIAFVEMGGTLDSLYSILKGAIEKKKGEKTSFSLGSVNMIAQNVSSGKWVHVYRLSDGAYFGLSKRFLDKLFNR